VTSYVLPSVPPSVCSLGPKNHLFGIRPPATPRKLTQWIYGEPRGSDGHQLAPGGPTHPSRVRLGRTPRKGPHLRSRGASRFTPMSVQAYLKWISLTTTLLRSIQPARANWDSCTAPSTGTLPLAPSTRSLPFISGKSQRHRIIARQSMIHASSLCF
jgi:hypothetical protein